MSIEPTVPHLEPAVVAVVHPINTVEHPTYPPGYRWAVNVGGRPVNDLDFCVGAGACETEQEASVRAEEVGAAVTLGLRLVARMQAKYSFYRMDWDPIPAAADNRPLIKFGKDNT